MPGPGWTIILRGTAGIGMVVWGGKYRKEEEGKNDEGKIPTLDKTSGEEEEEAEVPFYYHTFIFIVSYKLSLFGVTDKKFMNMLNHKYD